MITMIIGSQGSGKSLQAVLFALDYMKKGYTVYSNLYLKGARKLDVTKDLMKYDLGPNSIIIWDEAGSYGLSTRGNSYKTSNKSEYIELFSMHRHYKIHDVIVVCPKFGDIIPIVRENASRIVVARKSISNLFGLNKTRSISSNLVIAENGGVSTPSDTYSWDPWSTKYYRRKKAYAMYDTYAKRDLQEKGWEVWGSTDIQYNKPKKDKTEKTESKIERSVTQAVEKIKQKIKSYSTSATAENKEEEQ